ncbi:MAG TPA: ribosome silencing factor [bacterium]|nr:ribosome silencing factor [bacterium]
MKKGKAIIDKEQKKRLELILKTLDAKKGMDIKVLNTLKMSSLWDYFVVCTGSSASHIKSLYDALDRSLSQIGENMLHRETGFDSRWIVADYGDIMVHIFDREMRDYYAIEKIWGEKEESPLLVVRKARKTGKKKAKTLKKKAVKGGANAKRQKQNKRKKQR